jgi:PAS domain S-box-containing protein
MDYSDQSGTSAAITTLPGLSHDPELPRFLHNLPFPVAVLQVNDGQTIIAFVNPTFVQTFGYTLADIPTLDVWAIKAYPDEAYRMQIFEDWEQQVASAIDSQVAVPTRGEVEIVTKDGKTRQVLINITALDQSLIVAFADISLQREAEAELRNVRYFLERTAYELTENIPVGTYTMVQPADGGLAYFKFMSTRFLELTGLDREEARRDPLKGFACVHPEDFDEWLRLNTEAFTQRKRFYGETRVVVKGEVRWITAESIPRSMPDGSTVWEGVLADITERKLAEQALVAAKLKAENLERIKTDFLAQMSHEIRTPLTTLLGLAQLMATEELAPTHQNKIAQIQATGQLLLGIVNDVLDLSKIEAGQLVIDALPFELEHLVERVIETQAATIERDVTLTASLPDPPLGWVQGDARRLEQILTNLIGNAIKFTEHGSIKVVVEVLSANSESAHLRFAIEDTGIGIDSKAVTSLFEPFAQAEAGITRQYGGTGLGLSISKQLIELMDGTIGVQSQLGKGSRFWVELRLAFAQAPINPTARGNTGDFSVGMGKPSYQLAGLRVLVVDDSRSIRWLVAEFLAREGVACEFAQDGKQALALLRTASDAFDAVLMDIQMPIMDGLTATRAIRTDLGLVHLPIFAMTAGLLAEQQARVREVGINDVIPKPIDFTQMMTTIDRFTQESPRRQPYLAAKPTITVEHEPVESATSELAPFPVIEGIDLSHARSTMDGNVEFYGRLLQLFVDEFDHTIAMLAAQPANLTAANDISAQQEHHLELARLVHSLCGAASQIGAVSVCEKARVLEKSLRAHSPEIERQLTDLQIELARLARLIRQALK